MNYVIVEGGSRTLAQERAPLAGLSYTLKLVPPELPRQLP